MLNKIILIILVLCMLSISTAQTQVLYHKYNENNTYAYDYSSNDNYGTIYNDKLVVGIEQSGIEFHGGNDINIDEIYDSSESYISMLIEFDGYLYAGTANNGIILRTSDGTNWVEVYDSATESFIYSMEIFNNYLYASTSDGGTILRSSDGTNWVEVHDSTETYIFCLKTFDNYLYAGTGGNGLILRTSDGTNWVEVYDSATETFIITLEVCDNYLYAGTGGNGLILRTSDGTNWVEVYDSPAETQIYTLEIFNRCIYGGTTGEGTILKSCDGTNWVEVYDSATETNIYKIFTYNNYIYAGTGQDALILRSADGINWVEIYDHATQSQIYSIYNFNDYIYFGTVDSGIILNQDTSQDTYIEVINSSELSFVNGMDQPFSVSCWVKHDQFITESLLEKGIFTGVSGSCTAEYTIKIPEGSNKCYFYLNDGLGGYLYTATTQNYVEFDTLNGWVHKFVTYTGSEAHTGMKIYMNGELVSTDSGEFGNYQGMQELNGSLYVGQSVYNGEIHYFEGVMDELIIYDYCVSSSEVENIYNEYVKTGYTITLLNNDILHESYNFSVYKDNIFDAEYQSGDTVVIDNTYNYSFVLHENYLDGISNIENIPEHINNNSTLFMYSIMLMAFIGLLWFIFRRK